MLLVIAILLVVFSGGLLFSLSNTSRGIKYSPILKWFKVIFRDVIDNPAPLTFMILANKLEYAPSLKPFLTMGRRAKLAFKLMLMSLMFFVISAAWNFAMVTFSLDNSPFSVTLGIIHAIWIGMIFLLVLDIFWRIFMLTISNIYSGLSEEGYAGVTGKFLSIAIILAVVVMIILIPDNYNYIVSNSFVENDATGGIEIKYLYLTMLFASAFSWMILISILIKTMNNPKSLLTKGATVKQSKDVSSQIIRGGLLIIVFLVVSMWATVYSLERYNNLSWAFPEWRVRLHSFYYVIETMSTVGYGGHSPLTAPALIVAGSIMLTSVITIGMFVGRVFDKHELDEEDEALRAKTNYLYVDEMSLNELRQFCRKEGISIPSNADKNKIIEVLERLFE